MKKRNASIDIFRYICSIFILGLHTAVFSEFHAGVSYFFTEILVRIAVPFFFCVGGYFYFKNMEQGKSMLGYLKRILLVYGAWSVIYYLLFFISSEQSIFDFARYVLVSFVTSGSMYHFWYFPALMFAVLFCTLMARHKKLLVVLSILLFLVGCLCTSYVLLGEKIPFLQAFLSLPFYRTAMRMLCMGVPFFTAGYVVRSLEDKLHKKQILWFFFGTMVLCIAELSVIHLVPLYKNDIVVFASLYLLLVAVMLLLLAFPQSEKTELAKKCYTLANFTYYSHPMILIFLSFLSLPPTVVFFAAWAITAIIGCIAYPLLEKRNMKFLRVFFS